MYGLLWRWLGALVLVVVSYNPTSLNYIHWARTRFDDQMPYIVLAGLILFVAYIVYFRATFRSIGVLGIALVAALLAALIWVMNTIGILSLNNPTVLTWVGIIALSIVMGVGLGWSKIRRRLSGQVDVDDMTGE